MFDLVYVVIWLCFVVVWLYFGVSFALALLLVGLFLWSDCCFLGFWCLFGCFVPFSLIVYFIVDARVFGVLIDIW